MPGTIKRRRKRTTGKSSKRLKVYKKGRFKVRGPTVNYERKYEDLARTVANARSGGFLGIENKFFDTHLLNHALVSNGAWHGHEADPATYLCLNSPAQGDGQSNRDGKQIRCTSVYVSGQVIRTVASGTSTPGAGANVFIALVLDTQTNGAQLNSEDVYVNPAGNSITCAIPLRNLEYTSRFKVLKTQVLEFSAPNGYTDAPDVSGAGGGDYDIGGTSSQFSWYCKLDLPVNFTDTTASVANIMDNSLHIVACSEVSSGSTNFLLSYNARVRFVG